jgi:transposase
VGRPTKRTPEIVGQILTGVARGWPVKVAAAKAGVGYSTVREWAVGNPEFAEALENAEGAAQAKYLGQIEEASAESWQAAAWILERRWSSSYAKREHITFDVAAEVRRLAAESGLDESEIMAEAERVLAGS